MKDKILFGLFVVLAFSVGFTLGGIGKSYEPVPVVAETASANQTLASVNEVLEPFLADYEQRYDTLATERVSLQAELDAVKQELANFEASGETVSVLKTQLSQQQSEIGGLKASLQNAVNDSASWQQKFIQSQSVVTDTQEWLVEAQDSYSVTLGKLDAVNDRSSSVVNGFTAEEKATFYKVWDEWWDLVVVGTD